MAFDRVFIESSVQESTVAKNVRAHFSHLPIEIIDNYRDVFEKVKKPYLHKRTNLNIFVAQKKGQLVKLAPPAYGTAKGQHYYFIHAYNCPYECQYCYLQSYFDSPDLVFFANHQEIIAEIKNLAINATEQNPFWFHAGEFSDSLALSHVTGELGDYFACFAGLPHCYLELRTKSNNIGELLKQKSLPNVMTTFSLSPVSAAKEYDLKTPGTMARLKALQKLSQHSFPLGLHFDPIILAPEGLEQTLVEYTELLTSMKDAFDLTTIHYLSLGVIRFPEKFYRQVQQNYPHSTMHQRYPTDWVTTEEGQIKYRRTIRQKLLEQVKSLAIEAGIPADRIYYCME